jgi:hypothetical protein
MSDQTAELAHRPPAHREPISLQRNRLQRKRNQGRVPVEMPSPFSQASSTTIGAIGWAQAMPPKADSVGATTFRERSPRVASPTPDPSRASPRPRSRNRCTMRSKASSHPDARPRDLARCLTWVFPVGRSARTPRRLSHAKSSPFMRRCSPRSSESQSAQRKSRSGLASPSPSMGKFKHSPFLDTALSLPAPRDHSRRR